MKRLYLFLSLLSVACSLSSQNNNQNYVLTRTMLNESGTQYIDNIQYFDGLGRPSQNVQKGVTPSRANLVTLQEFDGFGRATKSWLPHVTTSTYLDPGSFKNSVPGTYNGDSRPYAETIYENSPLNRVVEQYGPGAAWSQHPVSTSYLTNTASGELSCKLYYVNSSGGLSQRGMYEACELYVVKTTDEDGNVSYLFSDKLGHQVLSRQVLDDPTDGIVPHDTYFVYDDYDQLRFVLPPAYQDIPSLSLYAYQYKYDERGRCIEKTLPGCQAIRYVYDKADNLVFSQDGVQRAKGEWTFYLYDAFHRLVLKGTCRNTNTSQAKDQVVKTGLSRNTSTRMILPEGIDNRGYTSSFGIVSPTIHTVNYYDDYTFLNIRGFSGKEGGSVNAKGLLTGNVTCLLSGYSEYCSVTHYDIHGRPTKVVTDNEMRGTETTATTYTFTGKPLTVTHVHTGWKDGTPLSHAETYRYVYDHAERLTKVTHQLDGNQAVPLSENTYDGLGRLQSKMFHGKPGLTTTYSYNIRNWTTGISGNAFTQTLYYNTGDAGALYNGNVCQMEYRLGAGLLQRYYYSYDGLNRLLSADYVDAYISIQGRSPDYSERVLDYDKQGNIRRLQRFGKIGNRFVSPSGGDAYSYGIVDDLVMDYNGNQLTAISDSATDPLEAGCYDYADLHNDGSADFSYDANGNLTKDLDKQITSISYNCLNLPEEITFSDNGDPRGISYSYDSNGVKRTVTHITGSSFVLTPITAPPVQVGPIGGKVERILTSTIYCGNIIYESTTTDNGFTMTLPKTHLDRILTEEGYITMDGSTPVYHYFLKDHLGNVRVVMNEDGETVEQSTSYYPFGGIFAGTGDGEQPIKFGGKEFDPMHGLNWSDFVARMKGNWRFMSIDPLCEKYYSVSPYAYCLNNPVNCTDPSGMWILYNDSTGSYRYNEGRWERYATEGEFAGSYVAFTPESGSFLEGVLGGLNSLAANSVGKELLGFFANDENNATFKPNSEGEKGNETVMQDSEAGTIFLNPNFQGSNIPTEGGIQKSPFWLDIGHELAHRQDIIKRGAGVAGKTWLAIPNGKMITESEKYATHMENRMRAAARLPLRTHYAEVEGAGGWPPSRILKPYTRISVYNRGTVLIGGKNIREFL